MGFTASRAGRALVAKALKGEAPSPAANYTVHLFKAAYTPTPTSTPGNFTESIFTGYAAIHTSWGGNTGPVLDGDDQIMTLVGNPFVWDCAGSPETIYGWFITEDATGDFLFGEDYEDPHELEIGSRHSLYIDIGVSQAA